MTRTRKTVFFGLAGVMAVLVLALYEGILQLYSFGINAAERRHSDQLRQQLQLSVRQEILRIKDIPGVLATTASSGLSVALLRTVGVDWAMLVEQNGRDLRITAFAYAPAARRDDDRQGALGEAILEKLGTANLAEPGKCRFVQVAKQDLFLVSACRLEGPPVRYLIVGERWGANLIGRLVNQSFSSVTFDLIPRAPNLAPTGPTLPLYVEETGFHVADAESSWSLLALLPHSDASMKMDVSVPRDLTLSFSRTNAWIAFLFLAFSVLLLVVIMGTLDQWVFGPLRGLAADIASIHSSGDFRPRFHDQGKSELAHLSQEMNALLGTISESRAALLEGEEKYRSLVETAGDGIVVIQAGLISYVNPSFCRMTGQEASELFGKHLGTRIIVPPDSLSAIQNWQDPGKRFSVYEGTVKTGKAGRVPVEINQSAIEFRGQAAFLLVVRDLSIRKALETNLRTERERLRLIMYSVSESVIAADRSGQVVFANPAACDFFSLEPVEVIGRPLAELMDVDQKADVARRMDEVLKTGRPFKMRQLQVSQTGPGRSMVDGAMLPLKGDDGTVTGAILVLRDVTEEVFIRKRMQDFEKMESLNFLAGGIAHDFNNIITAILNNLGLAMLTDSDAASRVVSLKKAEEACLQGRRLSRQLLDFLKQRPTAKEPLQIDRIARECADYVLHGSDIEYQVSIDGTIEAVEGDMGQISQVFANLILNARQAMQGKGRLSVDLACVDSAGPDSGSEESTGRFVRVRVRDSGPGIPEEKISRIFRPYFTTKAEGTGLGLAITKTVVEEHGGQISVESKLGEGTCFHVYLPVLSEDESPAGAPTTKRKRPTSVRGRRLLLIDDNAAIGEVVYRVLDAFGCLVVWTEDPGAALGLFRENKEAGRSFDVVVTDLNLQSQTTGEILARAILEETPEARVFATSGDLGHPVMNDPQRFGFAGAIPKPFTAQEFIDILQYD